MDTLYDLLGALPHDDAEGLRAAFRRAVKGAHPDIRPGDPDAALKFREIVRANEILSDPEQREAYDDLLDLARLEQESVSLQAIAVRSNKVASGVMALAGAALMAAGGFLLFMHMSAASDASTNNVDVAMRASPQLAALGPVGSSDRIDKSSSSTQHENTCIATEAMVPRAFLSRIDAEHALPANAAPDLAADEARSSRGEGIFASRSSDLSSSLADLDQAFQFHPKLLPAYVDRRFIFYRLGTFDDVDTAPERRIEKASRVKSAPVMARKPRFEQAAIVPPVRPPAVIPASQRRRAAQDLSRQEGFAMLP